MKTPSYTMDELFEEAAEESRVLEDVRRNTVRFYKNRSFEEIYDRIVHVESLVNNKAFQLGRSIAKSEMISQEGRYSRRLEQSYQAIRLDTLELNKKEAELQALVELTQRPPWRVHV